MNQTTMAAEENKQLVRDYVEAFNQRDMDRLRTIFSTDALIYGVLGWGEIEQVIPIWKELRAFGIKLQIQSLIAEGDMVAARYVETGTSVASFRGGPVTGRSYEIVAMEWFVIKDGRIHRRWGARDSASQARQMGLPPPG